MGRVSRGFTLVELLTVLAIAIILIGTATWQVQRAIVAQRAGAAARRFAMDTRSASAVAARRNAPVQLTVDPVGDASCGPNYRITALTPNGGAPVELERICLAAEYPGVALGSTFTTAVSCASDVGAALPNCSLCTAAKTITFYPSGEVTTPGANGDSIVFAPQDGSKSSTWAVGVRNFSGRTRVYLPSGGGWSCP